MAGLGQSAAQRGYWRGVVQTTAALGALWLAVTLGVPWFAADLTPEIGGFPIGYWMAAQGALLIYLGIIVAYAWQAERLEARLERETARETARETERGTEPRPAGEVPGG